MSAHFTPHGSRLTPLVPALSVLLLLCAGGRTLAQPTFEIRGMVLDGHTGQPLHEVRLTADRTSAVTDRDGRFVLALSAGDAAEVTVSAVGYGVQRRVVLPGSDVEFRLAQDAVAYTELIAVRPDVYAQAPDAPLAHDLQNVELRNLAGAVTDDALRAVQALPGVVAGNDFYGTFTLRGSGFQNVGLYIDGVLLTAPFHTIRNLNDAYSLSILNNDVIEGVTVIGSGAPAAYGDRVGGVVSLGTRDGNSERTSARATLGATGASVFAEGPLGPSVSWLFGARKSFLDYVVNAVQDTPSFVVGYVDAQGKVSVRRGNHRASVFFLTGTSDYTDNEGGLPRNDVSQASADTHLINARWVWTPSAAMSVTSAGYWTREAGVNRNAVDEPLFDSTSTQLGARSDLRVGFGRSHELWAGLVARRLSEQQAAATFPRAGPATSASAYDRSYWQPGAYLQQRWSSPTGRVAITAGMRLEHSGALDVSALTPRASGTLRVVDGTRVSLSLGRYLQFPNLDQLGGAVGNPTLTAEESRQLAAGLEQRVSPTVRAQVQVYRQQESRRIGQTALEFRRSEGRIVAPTNGTLQNSLSGTSQGIEVLLQRRSANGLTGWVSYALARAERRDGLTGQSFDSDFDQRHTVNAYLSYRTSDRTSVSAKYRFGSNLPAAGFYETTDAGGFQLSAARNRLRLPPYSRLDVRANRTFAIRRARLTVSAEIVNVLNHENVQFTGQSVFFPSGRVTFNRDTGFPLLPVGSLTLEW